jgi:hypothetical protein
MNQTFQGWAAVAESLQQEADRQSLLAREKGESAAHLNRGQCASLRAIASRITTNGVVIADEVGMGKTRIAVEVARCVIKAGSRFSYHLDSVINGRMNCKGVGWGTYLPSCAAYGRTFMPGNPMR